MKFTRKEAILLAHLTNQCTADLIEMLIGKGYTKEQAKELLLDDKKDTYYKDVSMSLFFKLGEKINQKINVYHSDPAVTK